MQKSYMGMYEKISSNPIAYKQQRGSGHLYPLNLPEDELWVIGPEPGRDAFSLYITRKSLKVSTLINADSTWFELSTEGTFTESPDMHVECPGIGECLPGSKYAVDMKLLAASISTCTGCRGCVECPTGTYNELAATVSCTDCPHGVLSPSGTTYPLACPAGTFGSVTKLSTPACSGSCSPGEFCPRAQRVLLPCRSGYFCKTPHSEQVCATGYTSPRSSITCEACQPGRIRRESHASSVRWADMAMRRRARERL